ncbi:MAG: hypothetical protein DRI86_05200 [Bacteroidetes bacterium]|nr:MAG: hypothetical protein DRI86_05200 [Bacteroidota bacterium]
MIINCKTAISSLIFFLLAFSALSNTTSQSDSLIYSIKDSSDVSKINILSSTINNCVFQQPNLALKYIDVYSKIPSVKNDSSRICYVYTSKGLCYEMKGDFSKALEYDFKALKLASSTNNDAQRFNILTNIGLVYFNQSHQYSKSIQYFKEALNISLKHNNNIDASGAYANIGLAYKLLNNIDSALYYHKLALTVLNYKPNSNKDIERRLALIYSNIGDDYRFLNILDSSLFYKQQSIVLLEKNNMSFELAEQYYSLGYTYKVMNKVDKAIILYKKSLNIAKRLELKSKQMKYAMELAELYSIKKNYKKAYELMYSHALLSDSINSEETRNKMAQLQAQYDVELNHRKIEKLELESEVQQFRLRAYLLTIGGIALLALSVIIFFIIKRRKDKQLSIQKDLVHKQERDIAKVKEEKAEVIQNELKTQLEYKNKELTTHALNMMQKTKLLQDLTIAINGFNKKASDEQRQEIIKIKREINKYLRTEKDWDLFKIYFEQVNEGFYEKLKSISPEISSHDLKLSALIKLNMNIKESAAVLNIAPNSVKSARYRLRKKLKISQETDLYEYFQSIN